MDRACVLACSARLPAPSKSMQCQAIMAKKKNKKAHRKLIILTKRSMGSVAAWSIYGGAGHSGRGEYNRRAPTQPSGQLIAAGSLGDNARTWITVWEKNKTARDTITIPCGPCQGRQRNPPCVAGIKTSIYIYILILFSYSENIMPLNYSKLQTNVHVAPGWTTFHLGALVPVVFGPVTN